ncbi:phosphonate ABC transporter substrate-binding protein [Paracoccus sp. (in: a-proteobacteria)]|uniref:phosphonate ABC transporter substrate-binding protein n=1 Tax=Paracoccus sp. TaxID=267 RepID=UPI0026DEB8B8|nr:phosphonate ABC transporter substrate-binding protein [Paracoccus sp. (in: a-proteobacteria)]MDO5648304.1 phosphonate ABC transporter substrate-binding protein [Paracoccus sp. (in: a-proteobacteria)]
MKKLLIALTATTAMAGAVSAQDLTEFRIGLLGGENVQDRLNSNECFRAYAEETLGVPVRLFTPADYNGVIQGLIGGSLDMAWLGASGYAAVYVNDPEAVEPVMVKTNLDGSYMYYSIGFARADAGIASMDDMKGKSFAFADPNSTSGYLIPNVELPEAGYSMTEGEYFSKIGFSGGHEQTIIAVLNGDYDAGVVWADGQGEWEDGYNSGALRRATDAGIVDMNDIVEIWRSKPIAEGPIVLRKSLPQDAKDKIITLLAGLHENDPQCAYGVAAGETAGFTPIGHDAYTTIIEIRKAEMN